MRCSKLLPILICITILLSVFSSCNSGGSSWAYKIGTEGEGGINEEISSGLYLLYQQQALADAVGQIQEQILSDGTGDEADYEALSLEFAGIIENLDDYTVEDKPAKQWIEDQVLGALKDNVAINQLFGECNTIIPIDYIVQAEQTTAEQYGQYEESYIYYGIDKEDIEGAILNDTKINIIFENLFLDDDGKYAPSKDEIKEFFEDNYAYLFWFNSGVEGFSDEDAEAVEERFEELVKQLNDGEDFGQTLAEYKLFYEEYYNKYNETEDETDAEEVDDNTTDASDIDGVPDGLSSVEYEDSAVSDGEEDEEESENVLEPEKINDHSVVFPKNAENTVVPDEVIEILWAQTPDADDYELVKLDGESLHIVKRRELSANPENLENYRENIIAALAGERLPELFEEFGETYEVTPNNSFLKKHNVDKLVQKIVDLQKANERAQAAQSSQDQPTTEDQSPIEDQSSTEDQSSADETVEE